MCKDKAKRVELEFGGHHLDEHSQQHAENMLMSPRPPPPTTPRVTGLGLFGSSAASEQDQQEHALREAVEGLWRSTSIRHPGEQRADDEEFVLRLHTVTTGADASTRRFVVTGRSANTGASENFVIGKFRDVHGSARMHTNENGLPEENKVRLEFFQVFLEDSDRHPELKKKLREARKLRTQIQAKRRELEDLNETTPGAGAPMASLVVGDTASGNETMRRQEAVQETIGTIEQLSRSCNKLHSDLTAQRLKYDLGNTTGWIGTLDTESGRMWGRWYKLTKHKSRVQNRYSKSYIGRFRAERRAELSNAHFPGLLSADAVRAVRVSQMYAKYRAASKKASEDMKSLCERLRLKAPEYTLVTPAGGKGLQCSVRVKNATDSSPVQGGLADTQEAAEASAAAAWLGRYNGTSLTTVVNVEFKREMRNDDFDGEIDPDVGSALEFESVSFDDGSQAKEPRSKTNRGHVIKSVEKRLTTGFTELRPGLLLAAIRQPTLNSLHALHAIDVALNATLQAEQEMSQAAGIRDKLSKEDGEHQTKLKRLERKLADHLADRQREESTGGAGGKHAPELDSADAETRTKTKTQERLTNQINAERKKARTRLEDADAEESTAVTKAASAIVDAWHEASVTQTKGKDDKAGGKKELALSFNPEKFFGDAVEDVELVPHWDSPSKVEEELTATATLGPNFIPMLRKCRPGESGRMEVAHVVKVLTVWQAAATAAVNSYEDAKFQSVLDVPFRVASNLVRNAEIRPMTLLFQVPFKRQRMCLHLEGAANLTGTDVSWGGAAEPTSDPYCIVFVNGVEVGRTDIVDGTTHPTWNQDVMLRGFLPAPQLNVVRVECYDYNTIAADIFLGETTYYSEGWAGLPTEETAAKLSTKPGTRRQPTQLQARLDTTRFPRRSHTPCLR